jgi:hypothetical protein
MSVETTTKGSEQKGRQQSAMTVSFQKNLQKPIATHNSQFQSKSTDPQP